MLKGIPEILSPELLKVLCEMASRISGTPCPSQRMVIAFLPMDDRLYHLHILRIKCTYCITAFRLLFKRIFSDKR